MCAAFSNGYENGFYSTIYIFSISKMPIKPWWNQFYPLFFNCTKKWLNFYWISHKSLELYCYKVGIDKRLNDAQFEISYWISFFFIAVIKISSWMQLNAVWWTKSHYSIFSGSTVNPFLFTHILLLVYNMFLFFKVNTFLSSLFNAKGRVEHKLCYEHRNLYQLSVETNKCPLNFELILLWFESILDLNESFIIHLKNFVHFL